MIRLAAPYPNVVTSIRLPNPSFGDSEGLSSSMTPKRAMNGTLYTYVKTSDGHRQLQLSFTLTRSKGEEFKRFLLVYASEQIQMVDHLGRSWLGYFTSNPIEFSTDKRGAPGGGNELMSVQLDFEGELQP